MRKSPEGPCKEIVEGKVDQLCYLTAGQHLFRVEIPTLAHKASMVPIEYKKLSLAILLQAAKDYQRHPPYRDRAWFNKSWLQDRLQSENWLKATDWDQPYSFVNCCERLGVPIERARRLFLARSVPIDLINNVLNSGPLLRPPKD